MANTRPTVGAYVRISTQSQDTDPQENDLRRYAKQKRWNLRFYRDVSSGSKEDRPALARLLADCSEGEVNVVLVWSLDRLARSLKHLLSLIDLFKELEVEFACINPSIDPSSPGGKFGLQVLGAVAELEKSLIVERVKAGLRNAKMHGKRIGRPPRIIFSHQECRELQEQYRQGRSIRSLAAETGSTDYSIKRIVCQQSSAATKKLNISGAKE